MRISPFHKRYTACGKALDYHGHYADDECKQSKIKIYPAQQLGRSEEDGQGDVALLGK